jgi:hypothetical protein
MRFKKKDLMILLMSEGVFHIMVRQPFLYIFRIWKILTYTEAEGSEEIPVEFKTKAEAEQFITEITE